MISIWSVANLQHKTINCLANRGRSRNIKEIVIPHFTVLTLAHTFIIIERSSSIAIFVVGVSVEFDVN